MKVQMRTCYASPRGNAKPGERIVVSDEEGKQLVDGGYATKVPELIGEPKRNPKSRRMARPEPKPDRLDK